MDANSKPYMRYDDEFKRSAVELLETNGRSMAEVVGDLGIPCKTLEFWRDLYRRRDGQPAAPGAPAIPLRPFVSLR